MIRVILPTGVSVIYPNATSATPTHDNGISAFAVWYKTEHLATIVGPCIIDDGGGIIMNDNLTGTSKTYNTRVRKKGNPPAA